MENQDKNNEKAEEAVIDAIARVLVLIAKDSASNSSEPSSLRVDYPEMP